MVLAGFMVIIIPLVCTIRRIPEQDDIQMNNQVDRKETRCERICSTFRNKRFTIILVSMYLYYAVHYIPLVHMVSLIPVHVSSAMCGSRKYPPPPRVIGNSKGEGGESNAQICNGKYEAQLEFPKDGGVGGGGII